MADELSSDEFDEQEERSFHETPHHMEGDRRAAFADCGEEDEVNSALDGLRARAADDSSDWSSSLDADSPRREEPPQPTPPPQPVEEEDDDSWAHLEVGSEELATAHPTYFELVTQDVCVMAASFASDFKLTTRSAVGWRGQVSDSSIASASLAAPWLPTQISVL